MALEKWTLDLVHSSVGFSVRHLMISKVHGHFAKWTGAVAFDEAEPSQSSVEVQIEAASIDTKDPQRDGHLKAPDFFDVERYPHLTFKSTAVARTGEGLFDVTGDLTLHGVTQSVVLRTEYGGRTKHPQMGERVGFSAHTSISRKDFGLTWNMALEAGGFAISDKVEIAIEIEAIKAA